MSSPARADGVLEDGDDYDDEDEEANKAKGGADGG